MPSTPPRRPVGGRPRKDAAAVAAGLVHLDNGDLAAAVAASGCSAATLYRRQAERDAASPRGPNPPPAPRPLPAPAPPLPPVFVAPPPPEPEEDFDDDIEEPDETEIPTTLARVRRLLRKVERRAERAPPTKFPALGSLLERLYAREARLLGPPKPEPDAVLAKLAELDGAAIALIEQHLPDPITPTEVRAA